MVHAEKAFEAFNAEKSKIRERFGIASHADHFAASHSYINPATGPAEPAGAFYPFVYNDLVSLSFRWFGKRYIESAGSECSR
jgi:hypothetical protein